MESEYARLSLRWQCELLGINRASPYYQAVGEGAENLELMRLIDEQYTHCPFYGSRRLSAWLQGQGFEVNRKRVARLKRVMELEAVYSQPRLSQPGEGHKVYPYRLQRVPIERVSEVRCGARTSLTFAQRRGPSTWWQSWTGSAGTC